MSTVKREIAFSNGANPANHLELDYLFHKAILETPGERFHNIRRAKIDRYILSHYTVQLEPMDLLWGRKSTHFVLTPEMEEEQKLGQLILDNCAQLSGTYSARTGHRVIDYEKLLNRGILAVMEDIRQRMASVTFHNPEDAERAVTYESMLISLQAVLDFAVRVREAIQTAADAAEEPVDKARLSAMAANFLHAPAEPCTHFYEAVQCMWFMQTCLRFADDVTLTGHPDRYLYPFYKKDIESGILTKEFAMEIIEDLYYKHNELYDSWPASIIVGGKDAEGNNVCNDITYMCIEAIRTTKLINPSVAVIYTDDMSDDLLKKCVEILADGYTRPSIFNDRIIQEGLIAAGVSKEDACNYMHSTCVEITPVASANILVSTPYINLCKAFEYILYEKEKPYKLTTLPVLSPGWGGVEKETYLARDIDFSLDAIETYEQFLTLLKDVVASIVDVHVRSVVEYAYSRSLYQSSPMASPFLNDCITLGKDASAGGARYNFIYPDFPGAINFIDSIAAIKKCVFDEKRFTLKELGRYCKEDFAGNEAVRAYLVNRCPKFGNNDPEADQIAVDIYNFLDAQLNEAKEVSGGTCHPSYFAYIIHGLMGELTDATPDGRPAGAALSEHIGSCSGRDKKGPLAVMRSIAQLDQRKGIGGIATNYRFAKPFISSEKGAKAVADFIRVFMDNDCFEIQFNVVDQKDLIAAKNNPENYETLLVRVAGYSDYFVRLPENIQNEIIMRTENATV